MQHGPAPARLLAPLRKATLAQKAPAPPEALAPLAGPVVRRWPGPPATPASPSPTETTRRAYAADRKAFAARCEAGGVSALPAARAAGRGRSPGELRWHARPQPSPGPSSPSAQAPWVDGR